MQTIADRFLVGYPQDGEWHMPNVQVVSVYVDQRVRQADAAPTGYERAMSGEVTDYNRLKASHGHPPIAHSAQQSHPSGTAAEPENLGLATDLSEPRSKQFGFRLCRNIPEALRVGGSKIAVDAVLAIAEQAAIIRTPATTMGKSCCQPTISFSSASRSLKTRTTVFLTSITNSSPSASRSAKHGENRSADEFPAAGRLLHARYLALAGRGCTAGRAGGRGGDGWRRQLRRHGFRCARRHAVHAGATQGRRNRSEGGAVARGRRRLGGQESRVAGRKI